MDKDTKAALIAIGGIAFLSWLFKREYYRCPRCNYPVSKENQSCPNCGQPLAWRGIK